MSDMHDVSQSTLKICWSFIYNSDETEVPLESHPPKAVASGCLLIFRKEVLMRLLLMAFDDGYDRLNYRRFLPEYWEYRHISKYMVRVGLYVHYCVDKVKQRVLFTMDVPETATVCRLFIMLLSFYVQKQRTA